MLIIYDGTRSTGKTTLCRSTTHLTNGTYVKPLFNPNLNPAIRAANIFLPLAQSSEVFCLDRGHISAYVYDVTYGRQMQYTLSDIIALDRILANMGTVAVYTSCNPEIVSQRNIALGKKNEEKSDRLISLFENFDSVIPTLRLDTTFTSEASCLASISSFLRTKQLFRQQSTFWSRMIETGFAADV